MAPETAIPPIEIVSLVMLSNSAKLLDKYQRDIIKTSIETGSTMASLLSNKSRPYIEE
ncbi:hypothetical protein V1502_12585 [Bacillus sp. SCS-153A]|uniref:hypothetical protein n=1 Tax=Rossellomorea sedimentorum TaxID=3115294 RepID=UPI003905A45E